MEDAKPVNQLNVSLEDHLYETLRAVDPLLPSNMATALSPYLSLPKPSSIPYSVLLSLSRWARENGDVLRAQKPHIDPQTFSMVALLAGTKTSPERNFGTYTSPKDPHQAALERKAERKAITALLNSILSVIGSGFAAWWAADKTGWKNEWKVLLGLFVAFVVAAAEAILYLIWQQSKESKQPGARPRRPKRHIKASEASKKDEEPEEPVPEEASTTGKTDDKDKGGLRRRQ